MGSLEDHYRESELEMARRHVREDNDKIDRILALLPVVVAHWNANPPSDVGWFMRDGKAAVAWVLQKGYDCPDTLLFPDGQIATGDAFLTRYDSPAPIREWITPQHVDVIDANQSGYMREVLAGLERHMPPAPKKRRRWWQF